MKKPKKVGDKSAVAIVKSVRQLGFSITGRRAARIYIDISEGHQSFGDQFDEFDSQELLCVKQTSETTKDQCSENLKSKFSHQRSPHDVKFEDRPQEETERQERYARGDAWKLAKNVHKLKETENYTSYSPSDEWVLPAASTIKPKASMHVVSKKDLNSAELETMRISRNPMTVMTANGEVPTREEATVYVRELDLFVTMMLLEDTLRRSRV